MAINYGKGKNDLDYDLGQWPVSTIGRNDTDPESINRALQTHTSH